MNHDFIRISAENLGKLALPNVCPRCFWLQLKLGFRLPYQVFPGIFSSLDSYQKRCIHEYFRQHGTLPSWLQSFGDLREPVPVPHYSRFQLLDDATGVLLTGAPDDIYRRSDNSLFIVDFKTAKATKGQDELLPLYAVQLNAYGYLAERLGMGRVSGLGLMYFEPLTETENIDSRLSVCGFDLGFSAHGVHVELAPVQIPLLLRRVRDAYGSPEPAPLPHCKDCRLLAQMLELGTPL